MRFHYQPAESLASSGFVRAVTADGQLDVASFTRHVQLQLAGHRACARKRICCSSRSLYLWNMLDLTKATGLLSLLFAKVCSVRDFGAVGDGRTDDSRAFQTALDTCGNVTVPRGKYLISQVRLAGRDKHLHLQRNTRLLARADRRGYLGGQPSWYAVYLQRCVGCSLTGEGNGSVIDGDVQEWVTGRIPVRTTHMSHTV